MFIIKTFYNVDLLSSRLIKYSHRYSSRFNGSRIETDKS